jgi:hypothetical protein
MKKQKLTYSRQLTDCLVIVCGFIILYLIYKNPVLLYFAAGTGTLAFLSKTITKLISDIWNITGLALGFVVSKIVLSIVFFFFLTPIALAYRLFVKNKSISSKRLETYWKIKDNSNFSFKKPW